MGYSFTSRVRFSEMDADGHLSLHGVLNYFQDCCTFQSHSLGLGIQPLRERYRVWVLSSWQIVIERYPSLGEELTITTWPYDFKGFLGSRNFTMTTGDGERLAYANSLWTYIHTETGLPVRLMEEDIRGYVLEEKLDMNYAPRKIKIPDEGVEHEIFPVSVEYLDTNHHVNNGQYVALAQRYLPEGFSIRQMRAEYKKQAVLGDLMKPKVSAVDGGYVVSLENLEGSPYAVVEFLEHI